MVNQSVFFPLQGSDVLYGFRKACRIWTDLHQSSSGPAPLSDPGPSSVIQSVPSGEYDKLESRDEVPRKIVVSYDDHSEEEPEQESTNLTKLAKLSEALKNLRSLNTNNSGESTPSSLMLSEESSLENLAELKPLLLSMDSQSTNSRSSQFTLPHSSQTSIDSKNAELQPLLLFGQDSDGTESASFCLGLSLGGESSSLSELRNSSFRRVSFAPNVVTSEVTVPQTEKSTQTEKSDDKTLGSKFLSNMHSLKSMVAGNPKKASTSGSLQYPRFFAREYPPSTDSGPYTPPLQINPPVCSDLVDLSTDCSSTTDINESGHTLKSDTTNQSLSQTPSQTRSHSSIQKTERSSSSPALLMQIEQDIKTDCESNKTLSSSTTTDQQLSASTVYESDTSSSSSLASSPCSSVLSFVQCSPSSSMRELIGLNSSDNSKHTLLTASSCDTQSEWASFYDLSPTFTQNVFDLMNFDSSTSNTQSNNGNMSKEPLTKQAAPLQLNPSLTSEHFSLAGPSCVQSESTLAKLFQDYATDSTISSPSTSQNEIIPTLPNAIPSTSELDSSASSEATLVKLFQELASQTSKVSSQFSTLEKLMSSDSNLDSEATLAKLFKESVSQTSTNVCSQILTDISVQTSTDISVQTSTDLSSQTSSFPSALSLSTERASHNLTTSTSSGSTLSNDACVQDSIYSLNATSSSEPTISTDYGSSVSNVSSQGTESTKWSGEQLSKVLDSSQSLVPTETSLPAEALLTHTQPPLSTSFTVSASKVIDLPSLMETLKHVTSLLATSQAILELSLSTLKAKLAAQPSGICVCTCQGGQTEEKMTNTSMQLETSISQSEPMLRIH